MSKIRKNCLVCKASFIGTSRRKYCSDRCRFRSRIANKSKPCKYCGVPIENKTKGQQFHKECHKKYLLKYNRDRYLQRSKSAEEEILKEVDEIFKDNYFYSLVKSVPKRKTRNCLRCRRPFHSMGNRLCSPCNEVNSKKSHTRIYG